MANSHAFATCHDGAPMKNGSPYEALNTNRRPSSESARNFGPEVTQFLRESSGRILASDSSTGFVGP